MPPESERDDQDQDQDQNEEEGEWELERIGWKNEQDRAGKRER